MKKQAGFTFIELIVFIIVIGITIPSIVMMLSTVLKNTQRLQYQAPATEAASQCLEWFLNTRYKQGYAAIACPSSTVPDFCTVPDGYTIAVNISCQTKYGEVDANYKQINVTVGGLGDATNGLLIANY